MFIQCLRSEPEAFDPVTFNKGINIITGEKSGLEKSGKKTNGVGKTLLLSFIDFCLLADYKKNRIYKVPVDVLSLETKIILDIQCHKKSISIHRMRGKNNLPVIYVDGQANEFSKIDHARQFLSKLIFEKDKVYYLRSMLSVFKRIEKIGYANVTNPDGSKFQNIIPYLFLFKLDINKHLIFQEKIKELDQAQKYAKEIKHDIEQKGCSTKEVNAHVNELKAQVESIDIALDELSQTKAYETIANDLTDLDNKINQDSLLLASIKEELKKIDKVPEYQEIKKNDIQAVFNNLKHGMGDLIVKEIDEIEEFKKIIDHFKNDVIFRRRDQLLKKKKEIKSSINHLSNEYKKKYSVLDKEGKLKSLKVVLHEKALKQQEYSEILFLSRHYKKQAENKNALKVSREVFLQELREDRNKKNDIIDIFQNFILDMHDYLYGNKRASFDIEVKEPKRIDQKKFINFHLEIDDSGSARTEHEKILIFDFALLFCDATRDHHIGTLIHDGAFEGVNEDTKHQLLNWLHTKQEQGDDFQYIVTINRDSFELPEEKHKFLFDLNDYVVGQHYTKQNRFLKTKYVEKTPV